MHEIIANIHMHTTYSDGHRTHREIAKAALNANIDVVIISDHNVLVRGLEDYYEDEGRRVLLLIGEEIHDQARQPQKNHLLVFGIEQELAPLAADTQRLLDNIQNAGGLSFLAHPVDPAAPSVNEGDLSWVDWDIQGYTGIELWNAMSEFKSHLKSKFHALYYALNPERIAYGPFKESLVKWDELLMSGQRVVAIGGTDAHALPGRLGPLKRTLFPYEFHFQTINTHIMTEAPFSGVLETDRKLVLNALGNGRAFIGYDLPASTNGFRFTAHGLDTKATMGEEISSQSGVTLLVRLPIPTECHLIRNGEIIETWENRETCTFITTDPGVYRIEAYIEYAGHKRGWIFSNPIYVKE